MNPIPLLPTYTAKQFLVVSVRAKFSFSIPMLDYGSDTLLSSCVWSFSIVAYVYKESKILELIFSREMQEENSTGTMG